jgi:lipopolysaccharide/colanic/teichoic acid biosynthesis glycosyltransferase
MHTVEASTDPSAPLLELSAPNLRVCRHPVAEADAQGPSPKTGSVSTGTGTDTDTGSPGVPSWKRVLDVTCILLSLPAWLPVVTLIAIWIKFASPGPILYRQERVGYRGRRFMIFKFRTMKVNVETESHERHLEQLINDNCPMTKLDASGDPRIIRGGRLLRAAGLDELPQLLNVLSGDMSLVGPRPCTPNEFQRYQPWQKARVNAPPGLTGYWQVNGKNKTTFTEMINLDIFYTKNMSLWLDLAVMARTLPAVMAQLFETRIKNRVAGDSGKSVVGPCSQ